MYKILLCLRYLKTRYIALASVISVMLGVATMIVVNSVMSGFGSEMRSRIHGILADVIVETSSLDGQKDADWHLALIREKAGDFIDSMTATVEVYGMLSFQYDTGQWITRPITLIGVKPEEKAKVGPLVDYLTSYHPIKEGDTVVRPPLRTPGTPPGWELTDEAMAYRRTWKAHEDFIYRQLEADEPNPESRGVNTESRELDDHDPGVAEGADISLAGAESSDDVTAVETPSEGPGELTPVPSGLFPEPANEEPIDHAAVLDARIYVGEGLISYPYENRVTGKVETMMMVQPGDDVKISTVSAGRPPEAKHFTATIVDGFKSGMSEYDSNLVYCPLEYLQEARGMVDPTTGDRRITSIQIKLKDYADADEVVGRLKAAFPPGLYSVKTWEQKQGPLLAAVDMEATILNVLLFLIIAVAGFGILAIFFMIVVEKTRDIGILKALGASSRGVMSIFLSYGLALGFVGSGVGVVMGLLFVRHINTIESWLTWLTGRSVFDERIYYFPVIPTQVNPMMVVYVAIGAMTIAVLASILPARRASRLHPVESLRNE
jgi:lipoprotein-releasing system permease protein